MEPFPQSVVDDLIRTDKVGKVVKKEITQRRVCLGQDLS
jgi:hypothetical protein